MAKSADVTPDVQVLEVPESKLQSYLPLLKVLHVGGTTGDGSGGHIQLTCKLHDAMKELHFVIVKAIGWSNDTDPGNFGLTLDRTIWGWPLSYHRNVFSVDTVAYTSNNASYYVSQPSEMPFPVNVGKCAVGQIPDFRFFFTTNNNGEEYGIHIVTYVYQNPPLLFNYPKS